MFENLISQHIKYVLKEDILNNKIPPSLLFTGPKNSGKLTAALELVRSLSCTKNRLWNCDCESCCANRELNTSDLLIIGSRDCSLEIRAAAKGFISHQSSGARFLFLRSIRKLTLRFDSRLWETDDTKFAKAAPLLTDIEELITDFNRMLKGSSNYEQIKKTVDTIVEDCLKIQNDCMYDTIPVNQVRKISSWIRLKPIGTKKVLIIENADKMQESARNAFLKILEEPPQYAHFILTTTNRGAIMQTILSRVRPYTFSLRNYEDELNIIKRVFRDDIENITGLTDYLYSFLPVPLFGIEQSAYAFWNMIVDYASSIGNIMPNSLIQVMQKTTLETDIKSISEILKAINNGKPQTVYLLFLDNLAKIINMAIKINQKDGVEIERYYKMSKIINDVKNSNEGYNIMVQSNLENLLVKLGNIR